MVGIFIYRVYLCNILAKPQKFIKDYELTSDNRLKVRVVGSIMYCVFAQYIGMLLPYRVSKFEHVKPEFVPKPKKGRLHLDSTIIDRPKPSREMWRNRRDQDGQWKGLGSSGEPFLFDDGFTRKDLGVYWYEPDRVQEVKQMGYQVVCAFEKILGREKAYAYLKDLTVRERKLVMMPKI